VVVQSYAPALLAIKLRLALLLVVLVIAFPAVSTILRLAVKVSEAAVVQVMGAFTVMSPFCAPDDPVLIITLVPAFNRATILPAPVFKTVALFAVGVNVPPENAPPVVETALIVTSKGSINHVPLVPRGAPALPAPDMLKSLFPEVSTQPPLPP